MGLPVLDPIRRLSKLKAPYAAPLLVPDGPEPHVGTTEHYSDHETYGLFIMNHTLLFDVQMHIIV